jgi:hypothetical protein
MELSFLTIVVSLAVCSLLVYAVFQYTKVRFNILEQSQKEQALILQEFIEESSTDIHRLYKLSGNNQSFQPQGSIILEYANDNANNEPKADSNTKQSTYNNPHIIHLDTAIFQNKRSNLIEISSDSEDTTESEDDSESGSESDGDSESDGSSSSGSDSGSESDGDNDEKIHPDIVTEIIEPILDQISEIHDISCETEAISDIKLVTVDLGVIQDPHSASTIKSTTEHTNSDLSMVFKNIEEPNNGELSSIDDSAPHAIHPTPTPTSTVAHPPPPPATYSNMSVPELRQLLKEKYKQNPEKHPEIQKLKKAELIYALQNTHPV